MKSGNRSTHPTIDIRAVRSLSAQCMECDFLKSLYTRKTFTDVQYLQFTNVTLEPEVIFRPYSNPMTHFQKCFRKSKKKMKSIRVSGCGTQYCTYIPSMSGLFF